ncbi:IspD/TarI family cytidylyltransferase [uncultured Fibrobacter sp.]|uniref:IspD/TarI family cytidylyltransferase n=1 Tax=uncultured Fibrobacter sp. TaxID=261512 RepID=UPI002803A170|nr:IspD/TarI family cytidylyltransferase [uncultured Fibrobacter sp.]
MNVALIFAGGSGSRMNSKSLPKQFLVLNGRAIIIHTLEYFERHPEIDSICVVCIESWIAYLKGLLEKHGIQKVHWVVPGGSTGQESIYNGVKVLHNAGVPDDSVVLVHDGVRPLISDQLITDCIQCARQNGNAITVAPVVETIICTDDNNKIADIYNRSRCHMARAPQCFRMGDFYRAHEDSHLKGIVNFIDSACLMKEYGHTLHMVEGPTENIKITTPMDFYLMRAFYEARENSQIFGM